MSKRGEAKQRLHVLKNVRAAVWEARDAESLLRRVARCLVPDVAEYCVLDMVDGKRLRRVEIAHADASQQDQLREACARALHGARGRVSRAIASGQADVVEHVTAPVRSHLEPGDLD